MRLQPKARFLVGEHAKPFLDMAAKPSFHAALEAALSQMQISATGSPDPAASWHRFAGAKEIIKILLNIAELEEPPKRPATRDNLQPVK